MAYWTRRALLEAGRAFALRATARAWSSLAAAAEEPLRAQEQALRRAAEGLARTRYGARFGVRRSDGYEALAAKLPIAGYEDLRPWIAEQRAREARAIVPDHVRFYAASSGARREVPCGEQLWSCFRAAYAAWLHDLLARGPRLRTGRAWIGGGAGGKGWAAGLIRRFSAVPAAARALPDPEQRERATAAHLLAEHALEIISVWDPARLLGLLETIRRRREELLADLAAGFVPAGARRLRLPRPSRRRLGVIERAIEAEDWLAIWPGLKLVSARDMGEAAAAAARARAAFPGVFFQGKGHLAVEAPVTVPVLGAGLVPVLDQIFFEFESPGGRLRRLHQLDEGLEYELIVTAPGGFARYRLGDRVRVVGRWRAAPLLELAGRAGAPAGPALRAAADLRFP